ncbi:MAG: ketopantoate reductase family protein [Planctomycetota bacterium]
MKRTATRRRATATKLPRSRVRARRGGVPVKRPGAKSDATSFVVQGPGAMGLLLAARMKRAGCRVTLLDYRSARAERLRRGITLAGVPGGARPGKVRLDVQLTERNRQPRTLADCLIVCVKAHQLERAVAAGRQHLRADGLLVAVANGVQHLVTLPRLWTESQCAVGVVTYGAELVETGVVRAAVGPGKIRLGLLRPEQGGRAAKLLTALAGAFRSAGFKVELGGEVQRAVWEKAAVNCGLNPVAALLGVENGALLSLPSALEVAAAAAAEVAKIAAQLCAAQRPDAVHRYGEWAAQDWRQRIAQVCRASRTNRCSMLVDLAADRRTEIDALCGRAVELGDALGIAVDVNRSLAGLVTACSRKAASSRKSVRGSAAKRKAAAV